MKESIQTDQHCCTQHCLLLQHPNLLIFIGGGYFVCLKKAILEPISITLIQPVYLKTLFQEKQELYTLTLLINNRNPEIFLMLIAGTKGKYLLKQKTQEIFLSSLKPIPHFLHALSKTGMAELGLASKQGIRQWLLAVTQQKVQQFCFARLSLQQGYHQKHGFRQVFYWSFKFGFKLISGVRSYLGIRHRGKTGKMQNSWNCCVSLTSLENYAKVLSPLLELMHTYA